MGPLDRITQQHGLMGGKACVSGLRVTVSMVVPDGDSGHLGVQRLQVKVLAVLPAAWLAAVLPELMILVKAPPVLCQKPHATT